MRLARELTALWHPSRPKGNLAAGDFVCFLRDPAHDRGTQHTVCDVCSCKTKTHKTGNRREVVADLFCTAELARCHMAVAKLAGKVARIDGERASRHAETINSTGLIAKELILFFKAL